MDPIAILYICIIRGTFVVSLVFHRHMATLALLFIVAVRLSFVTPTEDHHGNQMSKFHDITTSLPLQCEFEQKHTDQSCDGLAVIANVSVWSQPGIEAETKYTETFEGIFPVSDTCRLVDFTGGLVYVQINCLSGQCHVDMDTRQDMVNSLKKRGLVVLVVEMNTYCNISQVQNVVFNKYNTCAIVFFSSQEVKNPYNICPQDYITTTKMFDDHVSEKVVFIPYAYGNYLKEKLKHSTHIKIHVTNTTSGFLINKLNTETSDHEINDDVDMMIMCLWNAIFYVVIAFSFNIDLFKANEELGTTPVQTHGMDDSSGLTSVKSTEVCHEVQEGVSVKEAGGSFSSFRGSCQKQIEYPSHHDRFIAVDEFDSSSLDSLPFAKSIPETLTELISKRLKYLWYYCFNKSKADKPLYMSRDQTVGYLKSCIPLAVRVHSKIISHNRPGTADEPYLFWQYKGSRLPTVGSGFIMSVTKHRNFLLPTPRPVWRVHIRTARHVIFDQVEANCCNIVIFDDYDDGRGKETLSGCTFSKADTDMDYCLIYAETNNQYLARRLQKLVEKREEYSKKMVFWNFCCGLGSNGITAVIGHPHGLKKFLSIGASDDQDIVSCQSVNYRAASCVGCSGGVVVKISDYTVPKTSPSNFNIRHVIDQLMMQLMVWSFVVFAFCHWWTSYYYSSSMESIWYNDLVYVNTLLYTFYFGSKVFLVSSKTGLYLHSGSVDCHYDSLGQSSNWWSYWGYADKRAGVFHIVCYSVLFLFMSFYQFQGFH